MDIMACGSAFARTLAGTAPLSDLTVKETYPGSTVTGEALGNYTKQNCGTEYHPLGTCSMLPRNKGGVVDTNLLVYGSSNVRVIDASIMPLQISAHLMASTYGIAEKGADIIKKKYWAVQSSTVNNTTSNSTVAEGADQTASVGRATDSAVAAGNNALASSSEGISSGTKIGVGIGAGVGAAALLAALVSLT